MGWGSRGEVEAGLNPVPPEQSLLCCLLPYLPVGYTGSGEAATKQLLHTTGPGLPVCGGEGVPVEDPRWTGAA